MVFINEVGPTSSSEPRREELLYTGSLIDSTIFDVLLEDDLYESEDQDLALFGVGGPA
jgi:hypothetical protein